jgi:hypothetical protein
MNANYHDAGDNHPNVTGDNVVAPLFVTETFDASITYEGNALSELTSSSGAINTYTLEQNYPNPFNPSTTIKFSIPEMSKVSLNLYDLLGEKVMTLVNEEKNAGNYSVEFNASKLPSGIYFYQLKVGDFISTKKMILMK